MKPLKSALMLLHLKGEGGGGMGGTAEREGVIEGDIKGGGSSLRAVSMIMKPAGVFLLLHLTTVGLGSGLGAQRNETHFFPSYMMRLYRSFSTNQSPAVASSSSSSSSSRHHLQHLHTDQDRAVRADTVRSVTPRSKPHYLSISPVML